jgi:hypothetical protein
LEVKRTCREPSRPSGEWNEDDYDALAEGLVVGRSGGAGRRAVAVDLSLRTSRGSLANAWLRGGARGGYDSLRQELAARVKLSAFLFAPFFLGFALHRRRIRVLHFEPIGRAVGTVGGILCASRQCLRARACGVAKNCVAVALHVLIESNAGGGLGQVVAVQFDALFPRFFLLGLSWSRRSAPVASWQTLTRRRVAPRRVRRFPREQAVRALPDLYLGIVSGRLEFAL